MSSSPPTTGPTAPVAAPGWSFLVGWTAAWAAIGIVVAGGIAIGAGVEFGPVLRISLLFAEVVGYSAYISARLVAPFLRGVPFALRQGLRVVTALSGTVFGSFVVLVVEPLFLLAQPLTVLLVVAFNALLAVAVAFALTTYDRMRRQIEASFRVLRERDALERELGVARGVQRALLPRAAPEVAGLEVAGVCRQAIAVGGDYFDYLELDDGGLGLVVADVSGKGVPAALLMASLQASVRGMFHSAVDPATLNRRLNDAVYRASPESRYATAVLATYDPEQRRLTYSNAGHLPPLLIRKNGTVECHEGGLPIGLFEGTVYETGSQTMAPGDLLALFSDGVSEAPRADGEQFGPERLAALLETQSDRPLDLAIESVFEALDQWSGDVPPHDDVTLVLVRVL